MAKVALITYHRAHNNGSFLQAFATQQAIENLGHQCDVIDFSTPKQQYVYDVYKKIRTPKDVLKNCYAFLNRKIIQKRHDDFDTLINNNLNLTKHFYQDVLEMGDLESQYDIFLSGSDQIWNMDAWDYDDAYCLSFVKNKPKVSYASSLGGHILDRLDNTCTLRINTGTFFQATKKSVYENSPRSNTWIWFLIVKLRKCLIQRFF